MGRHALPPSLARRVCRRSALPVAIVLVGMSVFGGSEAFAFWHSSGSGEGTASNNTPQAVTIATNATPATPLQPGEQGDLVITVSNPNTFDVRLTAFSISSVTGCTTPAVSATGSGVPLTIPAETVAARRVLANAIEMGANASSDCQGVTLTINLTPTVQQ